MLFNAELITKYISKEIIEINRLLFELLTKNKQKKNRKYLICKLLDAHQKVK